MLDVSSAEGLLSLIEENDVKLQAYSLRRLASLIDCCWPEISDHVSKIEDFFENEEFPDRQLASYIISKIYFYLGEYEEATNFALTAGNFFDLDKIDEYTQTIYAHCIDFYIESRKGNEEQPGNLLENGTKVQNGISKDNSAKTNGTGHMNEDEDMFDEYIGHSAKKDSKIFAQNRDLLIRTVERIIERCFQRQEWKQAVGIAVDSKRIDTIEEAIKRSGDTALLSYCLDAALDIVQDLNFRNDILQLILKAFLNSNEPDFFSATKCIVHLEDDECAVKLFKSLLHGSSEKLRLSDASILTAFQIAFDLESSASQDFLNRLFEKLKHELLEGNDSADAKQRSSICDEIIRILDGEISIKAKLGFLSRQNNVDLYILTSTKNILEARSSLFHSAITFSNSFMHAGTGSDKFFRNNLEWLSKASNWSKFTATAALGTIHRGNLANAKAILEPYLPKEADSKSVYSEGGSLYALGLIHANHGRHISKTLLDYLKSTEDVVIHHGACFGIGISCLGNGDIDLYEEMKSILFNDNAISGAAAAVAMGLIMLGSNNEKQIEEMFTYSHETQHDKIIRSLAIGIALLVFGREHLAENTIEKLCEDADPILRYGGMYAIALAYTGTGNNYAVKRLLHFAVSDVNDDVRRAAVTGIGFVMFRDPASVPSLVELLVDSYNPHVRYGSALALGISSAGMPMRPITKMLKGLAKDTTDFVRQGAMIGLAMLMIQQNESSSSEFSNIRKIFSDSIHERHEDSIAKFGAVLAQGIMDAGGRNVTIGLQTPLGVTDISAVVGIVLFTQYWFWFPLAHCLCLSFKPTGFLGLNGNLKAPVFDIESNVPPSVFAYPEKVQPPSSKKLEKVEAAILSTTARAQARAKRVEQSKINKDEVEMKDAGDVVEIEKGKSAKIVTDSEMKASSAKKEKEKKKEEHNEEPESKPEPKSTIVPNFSRVVPQQWKTISSIKGSRYTPVYKCAKGIVMLKDGTPDAPEELIEFNTDTKPPSVEEPNEAPVPDDFEYPFEDE